MTNEFWHNKRVLVTGGNGFLGKHVLSGVEGNIVRKLNERGADVFVADIDRYDPSTLLRASLCRLEDIRRALSDSKPQRTIAWYRQSLEVGDTQRC
jgi:nucleoside-diphosphate-sugar epimerase